MAADGSIENFQIRANFFVLGDFLTFFCFKMSNTKFPFRISNWFFPHFGRDPKNWAQSKKSGSRNIKNDTKAGETRD